MKQLSRWQLLLKTSPSGKALFVCQACGVVSPAPTIECTTMVDVMSEGNCYKVPCSSWPLDPQEYIRMSKATKGLSAYISGIVVLSDGTTVDVSTVVPEAMGREIVVLSVCGTFTGSAYVV